MHSLSGWLNMGRFTHHIAAATTLLPQITDPVSIRPEQFNFTEYQPRARVDRITGAIATTPRRDGLLILDIMLKRIILLMMSPISSTLPGAGGPQCVLTVSSCLIGWLRVLAT
jgi:hypothetical protein